MTLSTGHPRHRRGAWAESFTRGQVMVGLALVLLLPCIVAHQFSNALGIGFMLRSS